MGNLRKIDFEMSQDECDKIIKLMDPMSNGDIRFLAFAKCFSLEVPTKRVYFDEETTARMLEIDPLSTYYISPKDQYKRSKFIPKQNAKRVSASKATKKNESSAKYDILHWK